MTAYGNESLLSESSLQAAPLYLSTPSPPRMQINMHTCATIPRIYASPTDGAKVPDLTWSAQGVKVCSALRNVPCNCKQVWWCAVMIPTTVVKTDLKIVKNLCDFLCFERNWRIYATLFSPLKWMGTAASFCNIQSHRSKHRGDKFHKIIFLNKFYSVIIILNHFQPPSICKLPEPPTSFSALPSSLLLNNSIAVLLTLYDKLLALFLICKALGIKASAKWLDVNERNFNAWCLQTSSLSSTACWPSTRVRNSCTPHTARSQCTLELHKAGKGNRLSEWLVACT